MLKKSLELFVVDDDIEDQEIFMMALDDVNQEVACSMASNSIDALNKLRNDPSYVPDYIFLDINMPKMTGLQCLPEIRKLDRMKDVKIIISSTTTDKRMIEKSMELGATDYLVKPTGLTALSASLTRILKA